MTTASKQAVGRVNLGKFSPIPECRSQKNGLSQRKADSSGTLDGQRGNQGHRAVDSPSLGGFVAPKIGSRFTLRRSNFSCCTGGGGAWVSVSPFMNTSIYFQLPLHAFHEIVIR